MSQGTVRNTEGALCGYDEISITEGKHHSNGSTDYSA